MKKLGFFMMGEKGWAVLNHILENRPKDSVNIKFVVSSKDPAVKKDFYEEISGICRKFSIPFYDRSEISTEELDAEYSIAIGWRWLIQNLNSRLIVIHDSLLPKYRGFNPLVTALIEGDRTIGVSAIEAQKEFDSGDIYLQEELEITYPIKIHEAIKMVSKLYVRAAERVIDQVQSNTLRGKRQDQTKVSYSIWRNEEDYRIDWSESAERIKRFTDAVGYPYKGAYTSCNDVGIRILDATELADLNIVNRTPGKLLQIDDGKPVVICGRGLIRIDHAVDDREGKKFEFKKLRVRLQ